MIVSCSFHVKQNFHTGHFSGDAEMDYKEQKSGMMIMACSPLGQGPLLRNKVLERIAAKHAVTAAAIALAFVISRTGVIAIPKAKRLEHVRANIKALDVTLVNGPAGGVFMLSPVGKDAAALQRARPELQSAQNSFRPLTAADRAAARPWVLKTVAYPRGGFTELARHSPLTQAEPQLRLIDGLYGGGEPKVGQLIKVVE